MPPAALTAIMSEAAVRQQIGGPALLRQQLHHLTRMVREYDVTVQVVPFTAAAHALAAPDFSRAAELTRKYSDLPLGAVDVSVIAIAERLNDSDIATTDRQHFYAVSEARSFTLHPAA